MSDRKMKSAVRVARLNSLKMNSIFAEAIEDLNDIFIKRYDNPDASWHFGNRLHQLRNDSKESITDSLSDLAILIKAGYELPARKKSSSQNKKNEVIDPCQICGESRAVQLCHVVPASEWGHRDGNLLPLCPTHHFLFDHSKLSEAELNKMDLSGIEERGRIYFEMISRERHKRYWIREKLVLSQSLRKCDCGQFPEFFDYPPNSWKYPGEPDVVTPDRKVTVWLACSCHKRSKEVVGTLGKISDLREKVVNDWNLRKKFDKQSRGADK